MAKKSTVNFGSVGLIPFDSLMQHVDTMRARYNPLAGMNLSRLDDLHHDYREGKMWYVQYLWERLEEDDEMIGTVIGRRTAALVSIDWQIKVANIGDDDPELKAKAEAQQEALKSHYERITNVSEIIEHLSLATYRGFAVMEKIENRDGTISYIDIPNYYFIRKPDRWLYTPTGNESDTKEVPLDRVLIRVCKRPMHFIFDKCWLLKSFCESDWNIYSDTFNIPPIAFIGPPGASSEKEKLYQSVVNRITAGARIFLPNGSDAKLLQPQGTAPFESKIKFHREAIVLVGTGGKLTVLTEATGMGSGASNVQQDAFNDLAQADAKRISEVMQQQIDIPFLAARFPGQKPLVYFSMQEDEEEDVTEIFTHAATASTAGYKISANQLSEKTGYDLTEKPEVQPGFGMQIQNRENSPENEKKSSGGDNLSSEESKPFCNGVPLVCNGVNDNGTDTIRVENRVNLREQLEFLKTDLGDAWESFDAFLTKLESGEKLTEADIPQFPKHLNFESKAHALAEEMFSAAAAISNEQ